MREVEISVVLPLYNDADSIPAVLEALKIQATDRVFEIIVVDDGSGDRGPQIARESGALVVAQPNAGPAAARNRGAQEAKGGIVLFLDSDCEPPPNWVEALAGALDDLRFDAVMGTIRAANDGVVPRIVQAEVEERYQGMRAAKDGVDFIAAPSCGFRRAVFLRLGGFDRRLRQAEDVEIAYRTTGAGHRIAFVDAAPVAHRHQTGWGEFLSVKLRRARGRMEVFRLFPDKRRHDSWTPLSLKLQFGFAALSVPALLTLPWGPWLPVTCLLALVAAGTRSVIATARRLASLTGWPAAVLAGCVYVVARAYVILLAVAQVKLFPRPLPKDPVRPLDEILP